MVLFKLLLGTMEGWVVLISRAHTNKGFSLLELMIGLAIAALLLAIGIPSYKTWIQNLQIRTAAEAAHDGLQIARSEAVRRNTSIAFTLGATTAWTVNIVSPSSEIQSRSAREGSANVTIAVTPVNATTVTFNGFGRVIANSDGSASITQLDYDVPTSILPAAESRNLRVTIGSGGTMRLCDPNISDATDPRRC